MATARRIDALTVNPTVLIVEDHEAVRKSLQEWLSSTFPGCHFLGTRSGEEALALACSRRPDIVLMDIGLPQMDGIEATRRIKAAVPQAQVVILTIHEDGVYRAKAGAAGVSAYVPKRLMHTELIPVLATLLSRLVDSGID